MDITLASGIASARAALELIQIGFAARDDAKVKAALLDANTRLLELSTAALALAEKNNSLQSQLTDAMREKGELDAKLSDRALYELHEPRPGAYVYVSKPDAQAPQRPAHYLCQTCYDNGNKSVLQRSLNGNLLTCLIDKGHTVRLSEPPLPHVAPSRSPYS